jgi:tetratricopeptide (TPR) repeat protein
VEIRVSSVTKRTVNVKFLAWLVGGAAVFGVGVHYLHGFQVRRNAAILLEQAHRAETEGRPDQAADYLGRYLAYAPGHTGVLAEYGLLLDKLAKSARAQEGAYLVLDEVLRRDPGRLDVRRRQAQIALDLKRYSDAEENLRKLRDKLPNDAEVVELLGRCQTARGKYKEARGSFQTATRLAPDRVSSYVLLARLLRSQPGEVREEGEKAEAMKGLADQTVDRMVRANGQSFRAYTERALYRREFPGAGDVEQALRGAEQDLSEARRLAPEEADVLLLSAEVARDRSDLGAARGHLRLGCAKHSKDPRMYLALAALELQDGKPEQAAACLDQGLKQIPRQPELLWELANVLIRAGKGEEAAAVIERLHREPFPPPLLEYLRARLRMGEKKWLEAAGILERTYPLLAADPRAAQQAGLCQAQCYERLGDADRAYAAYLRVVGLNPRSDPARLGAGRVLAAMGQIPGAVAQYRQVVKQPGAPAAALTEMAELLIALNSGLPADQAEWEEAEEVLRRAEALAPSPEVTVLQAEVLAQQGKLDEARAKLEQASDGKKPRPVEIWVALAALEGRRKRPESALALLDEAEQKLGDGVELRLARAGHWAGRKGAEARQALDQLAQGSDKFPAEEQRRLLRGLAGAYARLGATAEAERLWGRVAEPDDLGLRIALFDLALQAGDTAAVERVLEDMRRIEGPEGTVWRYGKAAHLIQAAKGGDAKALAEAETLLAPVAVRRPGWSRVPLCLGQIEELRKKPEAALPHYLQAIRLGERSPLALERAIALLYAGRRYTEAYELIRKLPTHQSLSSGLQKVASEIWLEVANDKDRALSLARSAVAQDAKDYREQLWLGRMLWLSGEAKEAEPAFRRALDLADNIPDTWVALIQYLAAVGRTEDAEREIENAQHKLPKDQASLALAQCYEAVGRPGRARELYQSALAAHPEDVATLQAAAVFSLRSGETQDARRHLEKILTLKFKDPDAARAAGRTLAVVLMAGGDYQESRRALALVGLLEQGIQSERPERESPEDLRFRAGVLALQRNRNERQKAIPLLEALIATKMATPEDQFLLAEVYESTGDWPRAHKRMLQLLSLPQGENPRYLAYFALGLLRHGQPDEVQVWLDKLANQKQEANSFRTTEIKARLFKAQDKSGAAVELLAKYAEGKDVDLRAAAGLLEDLKETEAAERMYRKYVAASRDKKPESVLDLAQFLGRRQRVREALDLCEGAWRTCPPLAVTQACLYIVGETPAAPPEEYRRVQRWLESAIEKDPESSLSGALAHLHYLQGHDDAAEAVYRKTIATNNRPGSKAMALNNLAFLLMLRGGDGKESLALVQRAIELAGPRPVFLDTRAVVALKMGKRGEALKDLDDVIREAPSASAYFHRAEARLAQDRDAAKLDWQQAKELGLKVSDLHPRQRPAYDQLARQLD